jgi:serine/threonine protein kinase
MNVMTETMTGINIRNEPINYKIENLIFSNENKDKIINLLKKNKSNVFSKDNINSLIKMVSDENKGRIKALLNKAEILKYNELNQENKKIIDQLLKMNKILKMNQNRGFKPYSNINNVNNLNRSLLLNSNKPNISSISILINVAHKYIYGLEDESIKKIFYNLFEELYKNYHRKNIFKKLKPESNESKERILTIGEKSLTLIPEIYYKSIGGNIAIPSNETNLKGSFASVYKFSFKFTQYILKKIKDEYRIEFKSLIFNMCLLAFLYSKYPNSLKYFCNIYEFGKIKDLDNECYAIMEYGGIELEKYNFPEINIKENFKNNLYIVLTIIKECAKAIKTLHDIGIIHRDIKPDNFLIIEKYGIYDIKIIDFGFCIADGTTVNSYMGTKIYSPDDYIESTYRNNKNNRKLIDYKITKKNDIFALGSTFLFLLIKIINIKMNSNKILNKISKIRNNKIIEIINTLKLKLNIKLLSLFKKDKFFDKLHVILDKITYTGFSRSYIDLSEFIDDIDILQSMLKKDFKN